MILHMQDTGQHMVLDYDLIVLIVFPHRAGGKTVGLNPQPFHMHRIRAKGRSPQRYMYMYRQKGLGMGYIQCTS